MPEQSSTFLRITLYDKSNVAVGKVKMDLNWVRSEWSIREDQNCWDRVGFSRSGAFEHKEWGVLWIWDGPSGDKNTMILWDAPNHDKDLVYNSGEGAFFAPRTDAMKNGSFEWAKLTPPLSIRDEVKVLLDNNLPKSGLLEPPNWLESKAGRKKDASGATGCGGMPGTVIRKLGENRFIDDVITLKYQENVTKVDKVTGATTVVKENKTTDCQVRDFMIGWKEFAKEREKIKKLPEGYHWTDFRKDTTKSPKPGDILITMDENRSFAHVCTVYEVNGDNWRTADGGQGKGFAIGMFDKVVDRKTRMIKGQYHGLKRWVDGWVDLESLLRK